MDNVIIKNKEEFDKKVQTIINSGKNKLHIISDFDRTLTKAFLEGEKTQSSYAIMRNNGFLKKDFMEKDYKLYEKYHPIEISPEHSKEYKIAMMEEWWQKHWDLILENGINKDMIEKVNKLTQFEGREGLIDFLRILKDNKIPLLILSAGVGDFIQDFFKKEIDMDYENLHIISNFYKFDSTGEAIGYSTPQIHVFNKNEVSIQESPYSKEIEDKTNVILLGDSMGDLNMADGLHHDCVLKIGFLNEKIEELKEIYAEEYDLVVLNDGSLFPVISILKDLIS